MQALNDEEQLTRILAAWAGASVVLGSGTWLAGHALGRETIIGFGRQTTMWGFIDGAIAGAGELSRRRRPPQLDEQQEQQRTRLRRILLINALADIAYITGGIAVIKRDSAGRAQRLNSGDGAAIVVQGAFLLALDTTFASRFSRPTPRTSTPQLDS
jgi:hypothetical protein